MNETVTIPMFYFTLLIVSIIAIVLYGAYHITNNHMLNINDTFSRTISNLRQRIQNIFQMTQNNPTPPGLTPDQMDDLAIGELPPLRHDYRKLNDPLKYPSRRYEQYPNGYRPPIFDAQNGINIPTQGYLPSFQMVGYVREDSSHYDDNNNKNKNKNNNNKNNKNKNNKNKSDDHDDHDDHDNNHNYRSNPDHMLKLFGRRTDTNKWEYYVMHHDDPTLKIPIDSKRNDELYDRDDIHVSGYPGKFKVQLYNYETPRYIPSL